MPLKDTNNIQESMIEIVHFKYGLLIKDFRRDDLTSELLPFEHQSDCSSAGGNFHLLHCGRPGNASKARIKAPRHGQATAQQQVVTSCELTERSAPQGKSGGAGRGNHLSVSRHLDI